MITTARRGWARGLLVGGLAVLALLLGGCVYLRLLEFKRQLGAFDRYFTLETKEGVRLGCLTPVLLSADFRWLGITPETTTALGLSERWKVRWVKPVPPGTSETGIRDVEIELMFTEGKLTSLHIPEAYFAVIPKSFLVGLIRGLGAANVDQARRDAAVNLRQNPADLTVASLTAFLGQPNEQRSEGARTILRYRYLPTPPGAKNGIFDITFAFNTASSRLVFLQGRSPVGQLSFNFESDPGAAPTKAAPATTPKR